MDFKRAILKQDGPASPSLVIKEPEQLIEVASVDAIEKDETTAVLEFSELSLNNVRYIQIKVLYLVS